MDLIINQKAQKITKFIEEQGKDVDFLEITLSTADGTIPTCRIEVEIPYIETLSNLLNLYAHFQRRG